MVKLRALLPCLAVVLGLLLAPANAAAVTGTWSVQSPGGGVSTDNMRAIWMSSPTSGLIVGGPTGTAGSYYRNSGGTWTAGTAAGMPALPAGTPFLYNVFTLDATHAWAVGNSPSGTTQPTILFYNGTSWTNQSGNIVPSYPGKTLRAVHFVDANNGWAVGQSGIILHTFNGGSTWTDESVNTVTSTQWTTNRLRDVWFLNALEGWAVGDNGTILHTFNGGTVWRPETSGTTSNLSGVTFPVDDNHGWISGGALAGPPPPNSNPVILRTTNGASTTPTWTDVTPTGLNANTQLVAISFVDNTNGWVAGTDNTNTGFVLATTSGGGSAAAWTTSLTATAGVPFFDVQFLDTCHGWATGGNQTIEAFTCPAPPAPSPTPSPSPGLPSTGGQPAGGTPMPLIPLLAAGLVAVLGLGAVRRRRARS